MVIDKPSQAIEALQEVLGFFVHRPESFKVFGSCGRQVCGFVLRCNERAHAPDQVLNATWNILVLYVLEIKRFKSKSKPGRRDGPQQGRTPLVFETSLRFHRLRSNILIAPSQVGRLAQWFRACALHAQGRRFDPCNDHDLFYFATCCQSCITSINACAHRWAFSQAGRDLHFRWRRNSLKVQSESKSCQTLLLD